MPTDSILGTRVTRLEDSRLLTKGGVYAADLRDPLLDGALYATYVRSTLAHGTFTVDVSDALQADGVVAAFTAADLDLGKLASMSPPEMHRPCLATDRVRFVGEPVAVVLTERPEQGEDAAEAVYVDYEPLPAVVASEDAEKNETLLFPEVGSNTAGELAFGYSDDFLDGCEVTVTQKVINQRVAAAPLEVRGAAATWVDGRIHLWISTQAAHMIRDSIAGFYQLDPAQVRAIAPDVGGGFGAKIGLSPEEALLPWLSRKTDRPVRWHETRSENMVGMGHGRGQVQTVEIGGRRDGTIEAYRLTVLQDAGAYPAVGAFLPFMTRIMTSGVYAIPKIEFNSKSVVTNTTPIVAYRGAGRPEAAAAVERAVDLFASEVGLDPVDVRRRNLIPAFDQPYTTAIGTSYDTGNYERSLDLALEAAGYDGLRAEQAARRERGDKVALGIGVAVYVEITAGPSASGEHGRVDVERDGSATVYTGSSPHGQGHETGFAMIVQETMGIPMEKVRVVWGDTDLVAKGDGTMGSRSLQLGGSAIMKAAEEAVDQAKTLAADLLEADVDDIVLDKGDGHFHVAGAPTVARTWADIAAAAEEHEPGGSGICGVVDFKAESTTFPFGCHIAVVDVDTETGRVEITRFIAVDDAGRILNPLLADGQRHGGIAQGAAQALLEEVRYDEDGNPITANFADYAIVSATELPSFELVGMETPTPVNPLGAKGIGESGTIGSTPAVQNAVCDALAHLGVRHVDMPCTAERVWRAIQAAN